MDNKTNVYWDPTTDQLGVLGALPATPASLKAAGYQFLSGDCESVEDSCIWLWKLVDQNRWYLALVVDSGDEDIVVASALCYSSSALAYVVSQFKTVGGVL